MQTRRQVIQKTPLPYLERNDSENDEDNRQSDGQLEERLLNAPLGAVDRVRLAEDTAQTTTPHLQQRDQYQSQRHYYLGYI